MSTAYNRKSDNVAALGTWAAEASADTAYPATNIPDLSDLNLGNPGKLTIKTAGGFTVDYGSARRIDNVLLWVNADDGQEIQIQGNATNAWGAPTVTTTVTASGKREDSYFRKIYKDLTGVAGYTTGGLRWWRIHFLGTIASVNTANTQFWGLKVLMGNTIRTLGSHQFSNGLLLSGAHELHHHRVSKLVTDYGYTWRYDMQDAPRTWSGEIILSKNAAETARLLSDLLSWWRDAGGSYSPFLLVPDTLNPDPQIMRFEDVVSGEGITLDELDVTGVSQGINTLKLMFTEVSAGGPEWT